MALWRNSGGGQSQILLDSVRDDPGMTTHAYGSSSITHNAARSAFSALVPLENGLMIRLLKNNHVEISSSEVDYNFSHVHPNCYAPAALANVELLAGGGSGTAVFQGRHPEMHSIVMKHGGPTDLQEVFSLSLISQELQERGAASHSQRISAEKMKQRIPEFVMLYISPFHLRDRSRELWSRTLRLSPTLTGEEEEEDDTDESPDDGCVADHEASQQPHAKKYIPRQIRLMESTNNEISLDVYFNSVKLEVPGLTDARHQTIQQGHAFLAELLKELLPAQRQEDWKFTVAQKMIGGPNAENGATVLTSGELRGHLLERLVRDFCSVIQDLRALTLAHEKTVLDTVRSEVQDLKRTRDVTSVTKTADAFVGAAIKKNFAPEGRLHRLRCIGEHFRQSEYMVLTKNEQIPARFLGSVLEPQVDLSSVFVESPAVKSALDYVLDDNDTSYWLDLLEHATSFDHPSATDRIWSCGLTDAGLHNLFLCRQRGVELFDLGKPQLSPQPAFLTKFFMSFFHALGMEENNEGTSWVRRFQVVGDKLDLTAETEEKIPYCYDAFEFAMDDMIEELFEADEDVRELIVKYVVLQLLSDAAFCLARWEEKGGGKPRFGARASEGLEKFLWRSLWDIFIACHVHQKLLIDGSRSLLQRYNQNFTLREFSMLHPER